MTDEAKRLVSASGDFVAALRANEGLRDDLYQKLVDVLQDCAQAWEQSDLLPRLAVNVLVDTVPAVQAAADLYEQPVRQQIYDCSFNLFDLISDAVAIIPT